MQMRRLWLGIVGLSLLVGLAGCESPNQLPTVRITSPQEGVLLGSQVTFAAEASDPDGEIRRYFWDFGDGETAEGAQVTHEYARSGTYRVEVMVEDDKDAVARDGITIKVQVGPKAVATVRQAHGPEDVVLQYLSGEVPLTVAFDGTRSIPEPGTEIVEYSWDFGDGETGEGPQPVHIYTRGGEYTVTLTVKDDRGRTAQAQVIIEAKAYEALEETLKLGDLTVRYRLHKKEKKLKGSSLAMFYQYIVEAPRRLTAEEIRAVLTDIIEKAKSRPRVTYIVAHLFDRVRENFMVPREYAHYLGTAVWDALAQDPEEQLEVRVNRAYLEGRGLEVLGYAIQENLIEPDDPDCGSLCGRYRLAFVELYIQDEPICRELLVSTLQEIARWRLLASYQGFVAQVYSRDVRAPLAWMIGVRSGSDFSFDDLPLSKLSRVPEEWEIAGDTLRIALDSAQVPSCESP